MSEAAQTRLREIVERDSDRPIPDAVTHLAKAASASLADRGVVAALYYGSCYRDGEVGDGLVDLYLLVDSYRSVHRRPWTRLANWLVPPNVYYVQSEHAGRTVRGKFAVVSLEQFERRMTAGNPYFWARFAQPTGIVFVDEECRDRVIGAFVAAISTLHAHARGLVDPDAPSGELWTTVLRSTYRTELRVEKASRARQIYLSDRRRFDDIALALRGRPGQGAAVRSWRWLGIEGKLLSVLRLMKAAFTFTGGADYLAWKIERHSGVPLELRHWQRRHPILAAGPILWRLWRGRIIG